MTSVSQTARTTFLPFALPSIGEEEIAEVIDTLRSGWLTTGPKVKRFERDFAAYIGSTHAIAVNSCTAGLHIALAALDIGPGDEVIVPTLTFCSTANVVVHRGATPVLVDNHVGPGKKGFNVTAAAIEAAITPRTKAIVPVHFAGQSCDLRSIYEVAARYNLAVVEDAAHAVGSTYLEHKIGSDWLQGIAPAIQRITVFSFYATKNMTTGEGGMITTEDDQLAERMRLLSLHGMSRNAWQRYTSAGTWNYEVVEAGYKYNMTDIQAALGIHQLGRLDRFIETRQSYARLYNEAFSGLKELELPQVHSDRNHVYHLYVLRLNLEYLSLDRAQFIEALKVRNIGASVHFIPVHLHPYYTEQFGSGIGSLPQAEALYERIVSIPLYPRMSETDVNNVIQAVYDIVTIHRG